VPTSTRSLLIAHSLCRGLRLPRLIPLYGRMAGSRFDIPGEVFFAGSHGARRGGGGVPPEPRARRARGLERARRELRGVRWPSALLDRNRADVVHLAEVDAVVAEDRVRHRRMEEEVRQREVHQVVVATEPLPAEPGRGHLPLLGAGQVLRLDGLEEAEALLDPLPALGERLLRVRVG